MKSNSILIIITLTLMCFFCNCSKEVSACFEVATTSPKADSTVVFNNCSVFGRGHSYWDFGDGSPLYNNPMPVIEHVFPDSGKYKVVLKVDCGNKKDEISKVISVGL